MARLVRAALAGLGAFITELIPAQTLTKAERALLSAEALHEVLEPQQFPCTLGECWHDIHGYTCPYPCNRECPDPAAPDAAAPSPEPPTGDTEPAGVNSPVAPAGSTNELTQLTRAQIDDLLWMHRAFIIIDTESAACVCGVPLSGELWPAAGLREHLSDAIADAIRTQQ